MQAQHPIVFLAQGLGTRIQAVAHGRSKALLEVAGQTIIGRLLSEAIGSGRKVIVYSKPRDDALRTYIHQAFPEVTVRLRDPEGYFQDVVGIYHETGPEFSVVDADIILPAGELKSFLASAAQSGADLVIGATSGPEVLSESTNTRALRLGIRDDGTISLESDAGSHRAMGVYHWREHALTWAEKFLHANEGARFRHFIGHVSEMLLPVDVVPISASFNVNTPEDLVLARTEVGRW